MYPEDRGTATVTVEVNRNENQPQWINSETVRETISDRVVLGYTVTDKVKATDADDRVWFIFSFNFSFA